MSAFRPPPTFWEAAADAILQQRARPSVETPDTESEAARAAGMLRSASFSDVEPEDSAAETETEAGSDTDFFEMSENNAEMKTARIRPPQIIINSENMSVKSYRSEV